MKSKKNLILNKCEIDSCAETSNLHAHHIIERTQVNTTNDIWNLAILCPNCHAKSHSGEIKIISVYPSTKLPNKRTLIYEINGVKNININDPYYIPVNKSYKISQ